MSAVTSLLNTLNFCGYVLPASAIYFLLFLFIGIPILSLPRLFRVLMEHYHHE